MFQGPGYFLSGKGQHSCWQMPHGERSFAGRGVARCKNARRVVDAFPCLYNSTSSVSEQERDSFDRRANLHQVPRLRILKHVKTSSESGDGLLSYKCKADHLAPLARHCSWENVGFLLVFMFLVGDKVS